MTAPGREEVLDAMAEVMERQGRVARAEATLAGARRRLGASLACISRIARESGVELPPLAAAALQAQGEMPIAEETAGTLRQRILAAMVAIPAEVFTTARLAAAVGHSNRDSVRNTLLVLAARGLITKLGVGRYQARQSEGGAP